MPANPTYTYDNLAIREDLSNIIANVTPRETQLVYGLPKGTASQPVHVFTNDTLKTVGANALAEGGDGTFAKRTSPTRALNYCQIISEDIMVSGSDEKADTAGMSSRMSYELDKAVKEYANDLEFALMRGTLVCGSGTTARSMKGLKAFASTIKTSQSGVSLSESLLVDLLDNGWVAGVNYKELYVGKVLKKRINAFVSSSTLNLDANDKRLVNTIDVMETTNGILKIFRHRYITQSGDVNQDLLALDPAHISIAYYRNPFVKDIAPTGDAEKKMLIGECTLEVRAEQAVGLSQNLL